MNANTIIKYTLGTLGILAGAASIARADQARWGGGFGGGDTPATVAPAPSQTRWAAGWGGQTGEKTDAAQFRSAPAERTYWAAGWGGEQPREEAKTDLAANTRRR